MAPSRHTDIEDAFFFVSSQPPYTNQAILCRESGKIYYISGYGDPDEFPDDLYDSERYVEIPHKDELDLGMRLVMGFISQHAPDVYEEVARIFRRKGAYSRFKALLDSKGLLEDWYEYEKVRTEEALKQWCEVEGLNVEPNPYEP